MKIAREPATALIEKERIRLQINLQVDDFLRSGGEINVLKSESQSLRASFGCGWQDQEDYTLRTE